MKNFIKKVIKQLFDFLGIEIRKKHILKYSQSLDYSLYKKTFINHNQYVNILQFADLADPKTTGFIDKIRLNQYLIKKYNCPICENDEFLPVANSTEGFKWGICKKCGLLQIYNRLSQTDLNDFYNTGEYHAICMGNLNDEKTFLLEYKLMSICFIDLLKSLWDSTTTVPSIVEIGCGSGGILLAIKEQLGAKVRGYDTDQIRIDFGKKKGITDLYVADAMTMTDDINKYDFVILSNILEHLHNPKSFLDNLLNRNKNENFNQKVIIDIPNLDYSYAYSDRSFIDFLHIAHLWYFNSITIERLINQVGFGIDYIFPRKAAMTLVCSKKEKPILNSNNAFWNSVSAINYANSIITPQLENAINRKKKEILN